VRGISNKENLFSKNIDFFKEIIEIYARGKYIALCEGDDYWIDDNKLQLQFDTLERLKQCDICACRAVMISADGAHELGEIRPAKEDSILTAEEVIVGGGMYLATASLFLEKACTII